MNFAVRRAVERGRRGDERHRHRARRRPRRPGLRRRALQRGRPGVDLRGRPRARSRDREGARDRRSHLEHEGPCTRTRSRSRGWRRPVRSRRTCTRSTERKREPADALALLRHRGGGPRPARAGDGERRRDRLPSRGLDGHRAGRGCRAGAARSRCRWARYAFAQPLDCEGAYLVRRLELGPGLEPGVADLHLLGSRAGALDQAARPRRCAAARRKGPSCSCACARTAVPTEELGNDLYGDLCVQLERPRGGLAAAQARRADLLLRALPADRAGRAATPAACWR